MPGKCRAIIAGCLTFFLTLPGFSGPAGAQEEVTSVIGRYREREMSRGSYEFYEVRPRTMQISLMGPVLRRGVLTYAMPANEASERVYLPDAHRGLKFYDRACDVCHQDQARSLHTIRANISCRQCHGREPIASTEHYYSPLNPIRRHAYICAKCHEGSSASFATYRIHEPPPFSRKALKEFPVLFYAFWIMVALAVLTFALFLPHTAVWGLRDFLGRRKEGEEDGET